MNGDSIKPKNNDRNDCSGQELHFKWTRPMTISTGSEKGSSSEVVIPIGPSESKKAFIKMNGGGGVMFKDSRVYRFKMCDYKIENKTHFANLRTKHSNDRESYLDIVFGEKGADKHSHAGFQCSSSQFLELRTNGSTGGVSVFEEKMEGITQGSRSYTDSPSGQTVQIDFSLNSESCEIEIVKFIFA